MYQNSTSWKRVHLLLFDLSFSFCVWKQMNNKCKHIKPYKTYSKHVTSIKNKHWINKENLYKHLKNMKKHKQNMINTCLACFQWGLQVEKQENLTEQHKLYSFVTCKLFYANSVFIIFLSKNNRCRIKSQTVSIRNYICPSRSNVYHC